MDARVSSGRSRRRQPHHLYRLRAQNLRWRAQVYLFLTLNKEQVTKDNWIYFPEKDIPFGRTSEMKNFSKDMCPEGKTSFFIEFFAFEGDEIWNMSKEQLLDYLGGGIEASRLVQGMTHGDDGH